jgi:toxin ParE1/3/4
MAEVIWTEPALEQLEDIAEYIALDKPQVASEVVQKVFETTELFENFRRLGRQVPEIDHPDYFQFWVRPCMLYYRIEGEKVYILHVRRGEQAFSIGRLFE